MPLSNSVNPTFLGSVTAGSVTAVTAGGSTSVGLLVSSTSNLGLFFGSGAPTIEAAKGSIYLNTTGSSTSTRMYVNSTGTSVWVAVTTAS